MVRIRASSAATAINTAVVGITYSVLWTVVVLIVTRVLIALGFGYNRFTARRGPDGRGRALTPRPLSRNCPICASAG